MSKIRINELARELEVKPNRILDLLPELGVTEKKTHSSSVDEDVADRLRRHFRGEPEPEGLEMAPAVEAVLEEPAAPVAAVEPEASPALQPLAPPGAAEQLAARHGLDLSELVPSRPAVQPLRPPLASTQVRVEPGVPARPVIPAKPVPAPKPGQIISGPRAPFPATAAPAAGPPAAAQRPLAAAPPAASTAPGAPAAAKGPLVGQPSARPVVPPRADILERIKQTAKAAPGQPQPRAAMPGRPLATPMPGQPIYQGRVRPGQPITARPGTPAGAARPLRARGTHPTARLEPPLPLPPEQQRREAGKRARAVVERDREKEREGKLRFPIARKAEPAAPPPIDRDITVSEGITVKELSEKLGVKASLVIKKLVEKKVFATINQTLDVKMAEDVAREFGASTSQLTYEEESTFELELAEEAKDLHRRPPVVTIMGHVDHGKTSLLDAIRHARVAEGEAGGITQHIGAYHVELNNRKIVFIDTPGHEAFTRMRARGAKVTDIVVLVVAADDGVMPQTVEAIDHARAAKVPIVVAINKIDKADAQPERIKQQLADRSLLAEDWGGDVVMVPVSAKAKTNLDLLLEMILLVADMQDLKANPGRPAVATVLEAKLDRGRGPVATLLVRNGTLRVGDYFICGSVFGKVRAMFDDRSNAVREAEPALPVEVLGLEALPEVGDTFQVVTDVGKAKQIVIYREAKARDVALAKTARMSLSQLHEQLREGETKDLNLIIKADVSGSAEVLGDSLQKLSSDKVRIRVLHTGVGAITETDVLLATASEAIIIGFNVRPERTAQQVAEREKVDIRLHTVIYDLTDEIKRAMSGLLEPVYREVYRGRAEVRDTFRISKVGTVAGCMVIDGLLTRDSEVRLLRDNVVVHTGRVDSLKRFKNDASEVKTGFECGVSIAGYNDVKPGDIIEAFATERVATEALV